MSKNDPEVRLELKDAQGQQVWALYSERPHETVVQEESVLARLLQDLPGLAWRWRRRVIAGLLTGAALGVVYLVYASPIYAIRSLIELERRGSLLHQSDSLSADARFIATQAEVIHSPHLVSNAFDALGGVPEVEVGLVKQVKRWVRSLLPADAETAERDPRAVAIVAALAAIDATPLVGTDVMAVTYRTGDAVHGVAFLGALIDSYRDHVRGLETQAQGEGLSLLQAKDEAMRKEIEALQVRRDELHAKTMAVGQNDRALSVQKLRLEEHARALVQAQGRRIELENRLALGQEDTNGLRERGLIARELNAARASLAGLRVALSDDHPEVIRTRELIEALRSQVGQDWAIELAEIERELGASRRTEDMLGRLYQEEWAKVQTLEGQRVQEEQIAREIDRISGQRDAVLALLREKELQVLSLDSGRSGTVVRLLDPPAVPTTAVWPRPGIVLAGFGFLGAFAGLGMAVRGEVRLRNGSGTADKAAGRSAGRSVEPWKE